MQMIHEFFSPLPRVLEIACWSAHSREQVVKTKGFDLSSLPIRALVYFYLSVRKRSETGMVVRRPMSCQVRQADLKAAGSLVPFD